MQPPTTGDRYFDSYAHYSIHEEMIRDRVRTDAYFKAICDNPDRFRDKVVLDVGSGTGILSIFAARAGARRVYAIEKASIAVQSKEIIHKNGLEHKITVIQELVENVQLP